MPRLTAGVFAEAAGALLRGEADASADRFSVDSRTVDRATAFVAVGDGHRFVPDAVRAGAPFVVVSDTSGIDAEVVVTCSDTTVALAAAATHVRSAMDGPVVGITGSTGKTLTKDLCAAAIGAGRTVWAAPRSYNNEVGLPLTVLNRPEDAEVMVVELGARHPGEIAELCGIARPTVGALTGIGTTHLAEFGSRRAIAETKAELVAALPPDGLAIVPSDDRYLDLLCARTPARVRTVGPGGHVRFWASRIDEQRRTHGRVRVGDRETDVVLPLAGRAFMRNAAFALAAAEALGVDPADAAAAMQRAPTSPWRMEISEVDGRLVVNDAWNANPVSMRNALRTAVELADGREVWAVLGPMAELGAESEREHTRLGALVAALPVAAAVLVGDGMDAVAASLPRAHRAADVGAAADVVAARAPTDAVVVVKASRVAGLERFPDHLATGRVSR